jgi:hypothetical protein
MVRNVGRWMRGSALATLFAVAGACSTSRENSTEPVRVSAKIVPGDSNGGGAGGSGGTPGYAYSTLLAGRIYSLIRAYPKPPAGTRPWNAVVAAVDTGRMLEYMSPFRDNVETYSQIAASSYQSPAVSLSVSSTAMSFKLYRGVETIYGGNHEVGGTGAGGGSPTCTDIALAFYDADRAVKDVERGIGIAVGGVALNSLSSIIKNMFANGVQGNSPANALTAEALERNAILAGVAMDGIGLEYLDRLFTRNVAAALMRTNHCI